MKLLLGAAAAGALALMASGTAASAQPYGYYGGYSYAPSYSSGYGYSSDYGRYDRGDYRRVYVRDRDHDGIPDRWDRYDNRREHHWRRHHHDRDDYAYRYREYRGYGW
jgi:hypothetical protein